MNAIIQNPFEVILNRIESLERLFLNSDKTPESLDYLSLDKGAEFLDKSPNALRVMVCRNQIPYIKKGGKLYFKKSELIDYLESGRVDIKPINAVDVLAKKKGFNKC